MTTPITTDNSTITNTNPLEAPTADALSWDPEISSKAPPGFSQPLAKFRADVARYGLVGEVANAQIIFLAAISSQLLDPFHVTIFAGSSAGKNNLMEKATAFLPVEWKRPITGMSAKALMHSEKNEWKHKAILIAELEGVTGADYGIRTMQSERKIVWEYVDTSDGIKKKKNTVEGPAAFIQATTRLRVHAENETRQLSVHLDESPEQTRAVNRRQAMEAAGLVDPLASSEVKEWRDFLLSLGDNQVVVPYAMELADALPADRLRSRRDFPRLINLIQASAFLHQHNRPHNSEGRIVASPDDYMEVKPLFSVCFATKMENSVREVMKYLGRFSIGHKFKANDVMVWASCKKSHAYEILKHMEECGVVGDSPTSGTYELLRLQPEAALSLPERVSATFQLSTETPTQPIIQEPVL
jgi:hypothetical protein